MVRSITHLCVWHSWVLTWTQSSITTLIHLPLPIKFLHHECDVIFQKYIAVGELGKATDTLDATGSVILEENFGNTASASQLIANISVKL